MVSIRESLSELERYHKLREVTLDCYITAIRNVAHYTIELEEDVTALHRKYLEAVAAEAAGGEIEVLLESRSTLRGLLRGYRDKAAAYINDLREELAESACALEEIMATLAQSDGNHENQIRVSVQRLREISNSPGCSPIRGALLSAADSVDRGMEEMRKQHQLTVSQFQVEIRMLHRRIDSLEIAAMLDSLSKLFNREEMEERIRAASADWFSLLLMRVGGLRAAERQFNESVAAELAGAFGKRLRNSLPPNAEIGRWNDEGFIAKLALTRAEAVASAKWISENLSGSYACLRDGKTVRPALQVNVAVVDRGAGELPEKTLARVADFFG